MSVSSTAQSDSSGGTAITLESYHGYGPQDFLLLHDSASTEVGELKPGSPVLVRPEEVSKFLIDAWCANKEQCDGAYEFYWESAEQITRWLHQGVISPSDFYLMKSAASEQFNESLVSLVRDAQKLIQFSVVQEYAMRGRF